jgi:uncharacterized protein (DUF2147 family)
MTKRLFQAMLLSLVAASTIAVAQTDRIEGRWINSRHDMIVSVSRCGPDYCATVVTASDRAKANARKGGTLNFIGTQILDVRAAGRGTFKGKAFDPETNLHVAATVRMVGPETMNLKACLFVGLFCEEQRWTKVS